MVYIGGVESVFGLKGSLLWIACISDLRLVISSLIPLSTEKSSWAHCGEAFPLTAGEPGCGPGDLTTNISSLSGLFSKSSFSLFSAAVTSFRSEFVSSVSARFNFLALTSVGGLCSVGERSRYIF